MAQAQAVKHFSIASGSTDAVVIDLTGEWSDGGSHTPHAYMVFYVNGTAGSTGTGTMFWGRGFSDGTTHYGVAGKQSDNVTSSDGASWVSNLAPIVEIDSTPAITGQVDHTSFATDTITLTPSNALVNTITGFVIAFYDTLGAKVRDETLPGATGSFSKTGVGFQGKSAIFLFTNHQTMNAGGTGIQQAIGFATGPSAQATLGIRYRDAQTSDYSMGVINTDYCMAAWATTGSGPASHTAFTSFDPDGYTCNRINGTSLLKYGVLVLGSHAAVVTSAHRTAVETWNITVPGITPSGVLALSEPALTASSSVSTEGMHNTIGAATANGMCSIELNGHPNDPLNPAVSEEYSRAETAKLLTHYDRTGADTFTKVADVEWSSAAANTLTLSQTDANATAVFMTLLVFGTPTGSALLMRHHEG